MDDLQVFHFDKDKKSFEDYGRPNGCRYWYASDLAKFLGYDNPVSFQKAISRAIASCSTLGISILDNFTEEDREVDGKQIRDTKLSRFACYLTSMNGDSRKPQIAAAQVYFAKLAQAVHHLQQAENVERVTIRGEISDHETTLSGTAQAAGVTRFDLFRNAGYRGLYNMNLGKLKVKKGINSGRCLLDFMGKEELAANLFRITQTEAKIKKERILGQAQLEETAEHVGRRIRKTIIDLSGNRPEDLPISEDIKIVRSGLKSTHKEFGKMDGKKAAKILPATSAS